MFTIRHATPADIPAMLPHFPRLAEFDVPEIRDPKDLWSDDAKMLEAWGRGEMDHLFALVAVPNDQSDQILGVAMVTLGDEWLSHGPNAHLEVLLVAAGAEGQGIARQLIEKAQLEAKTLGAESMSLHCFANNTRARSFYEKAGFDGELIRYFKKFN